jgi:hypothetical protein
MPITIRRKTRQITPRLVAPFCASRDTVSAWGCESTKERADHVREALGDFAREQAAVAVLFFPRSAGDAVKERAAVRGFERWKRARERADQTCEHITRSCRCERWAA